MPLSGRPANRGGMSFSFRHPSNSQSSTLLSISTFNVRGLTSETKRNQLVTDLSSYRITICCLQETKCADGFDEIRGDYRLLGLQSNSRHYGLGFAVTNWLAKNIIRFWSVSNRVAVIQFRLSGKSIMTVINAYGPTAMRVDANIEEQDEFFCDLAKATTTHRASALFYIAGDFNSKLGTRHEQENFMGKHSRGHRNANGSALAHFLDMHELFACNTAFDHPARHKTTWQGQRRDTFTNKIVPIYNMIDFILCHQSQKTLLQDARSYAGTKLTSDHRLVVARANTSRIFGAWGKCAHTTIKPTRYAVQQLAEPAVRIKYQLQLAQHMTNLQLNDKPAQEKWQHITDAILSAAKSVIGTVLPNKHRKHQFCPDLAQMSVKQRDLRLSINNTTDDQLRKQLKQQRNSVLHAMRKKALANASAILDERAAEVEKLHDGAKMFRAVRLLCRRPYLQAVVHDEQGCVVDDPVEVGKLVTEYFGQQFRENVTIGLPAFKGDIRPLEQPIEANEVNSAMKKLNNARACGYDSLPGELLKYAADQLDTSVAVIFNQVLEHHQPLKIGHGTLILLQKPGKPIGALSSLRPIVLLTSLRKVLSLVTLSRITNKVDAYLSAGQSGFRPGRGTADVVFGYRWMAARSQRYQEAIEILGIDMSRAFDTIRRDKLMHILETFLDDSELRMIRLLLADTTLEPRLAKGRCTAFNTTIDTPQGDSLSPVLFIVYLEAALRDIRQMIPQRPLKDVDLPLDIAYADDVDFVSHNRTFLDQMERIIPTCLKHWFLIVNESKTERTSLRRETTRMTEVWRTTKKLGSLLGDAEDVARRKQLALVAFRRMWTIWLRRQQINEALRLRLYNAFIVPVLTYNMGTWALTRTESARLDSFQRSQLKQLLGIRWPQKISNKALYKRCQCEPLSIKMIEARWRLFGHVLRMPKNVPAQMAIDQYFQPSNDIPSWRGRPRTTLPVVLNADLQSTGYHLRNKADLEHLRQLAMNRPEWSQLTKKIVEAAQAKLT